MGAEFAGPTPQSAQIADGPQPEATNVVLQADAPRAMAIGGLSRLRQPKLLVGAADDASEKQAELMAARVVDGLDADVHRHLDGCCTEPGTTAAVRRVAEATSTIGAAGGDLAEDTERELLAARGRGARLPVPVRRSMESSFKADFNAVRVHTDARAARLNREMSAQAFTLGSDIFMGQGAPDASSRSGQHLLAHELTHVVQQSAPAARRTLDAATRTAVAQGVQRNVQMVNRFNMPWRKTPEQKSAAAAKEAAAKTEKTRLGQLKAQQAAAAKVAKENQQRAVDGGATLGELSGKLKNQKLSENARTKAMTAYEGGMAGNAPSTVGEVAKPALAGGATAGAALGTQFGQGVAGLAGPAGNLVLGPLLVGDTALGLNSARKMDNEADLYGDKGMSNLAGRKAKDQGQGLLGASLATARAGVGVAGKVGASAGSAALGVVGGSLGVAGGSAMVLQGAWRGGKAVMKLCRLAWGRASTMLSERGSQWKKAIVSAEQYKGAIAAMKVTLGVLGIAAGALLIVSNPIGWGLGIAAAIAGGVYAASKIAGKISNARDRTKAAEQIAAGKKSEEVFADVLDPSSKAEAGGKAKKGTGYASPDAKPVTHAKRSKAIEQANEIARLASAHARLAGELRGALSAGDKVAVSSAIEHSVNDKKFDRNAALAASEDKELHDSFLLLSSVNVDPDEALSDSGQDLIEKKLSKTEAM
ncbi:MAG: hypothetical protein QOJ78_465 [Pseudonocardiales bacterium]|nr:hypothetical protein [Pseudonocardiales bacterium]